MPAPREQEPTEGVIYVNWARTMGSPYDLILDLGFRTEDAPPPTFPIRVVMSWEQAKSLSDLLQFSVQEYESEVGEIREFGEEVLPARDFDELEPPEDAEPEDNMQLGSGEEDINP